MLTIGFVSKKRPLIAYGANNTNCYDLGLVDRTRQLSLTECTILAKDITLVNSRITTSAYVRIYILGIGIVRLWAVKVYHRLELVIKVHLSVLSEGHNHLMTFKVVVSECSEGITIIVQYRIKSVDDEDTFFPIHFYSAETSKLILVTEHMDAGIDWDVHVSPRRVDTDFSILIFEEILQILFDEPCLARAFFPNKEKIFGDRKSCRSESIGAKVENHRFKG